MEGKDTETVRENEARTANPQEQYFAAVRSDNVALVRSLLPSCPLPLLPNHQGYTALHMGAINGSEEMLRLLVEEAHAITILNTRDPSGFTALIYAASEGWDDCVAYLLEIGRPSSHKRDKEIEPTNAHNVVINIEARTDDFAGYIAGGIPLYVSGGKTALHYAAEKNELECALLLVDNGADKLAKDFDNNTPYDLALMTGASPALISLLRIREDQPLDMDKDARAAKKAETNKIRNDRINLAERRKKVEQESKISSFLNYEAGKDVYVVPADSGQHYATLVFLHGLGDTGRGWVLKMKEFHGLIPHFRIVLPTAPIVPVTSLKGEQVNAWHDIIKGRENIDEEPSIGLEESCIKMETLLHSEALLLEKSIRAEGQINAAREITKLAYKRTFIAGFSQGGALSIHTAYRLKPTTSSEDLAIRLGGVISLSGYLPHYKTFATWSSESTRQTPALVMHGTTDEIVKPEKAERIVRVLKENGVSDTSLQMFPMQGHHSSFEELAAAQQWLLRFCPNPYTLSTLD